MRFFASNCFNKFELYSGRLVSYCLTDYCINILSDIVQLKAMSQSSNSHLVVYKIFVDF